MDEKRPADAGAIESETGQSWEAWDAFLETLDGAELDHAELARRIADTGKASPEWAARIATDYQARHRTR